MKKLFGVLLSVVMLLFLTGSVVSAEENMYLVYAQVPDGWEAPCIWAFDNDGNSAFDAWPGGSMAADEGNPGWYYYFIPKSMTNVIINANEGSVQTADIAVDGQNVWIVVNSAEEYTLSNEQQTQGDLPEYVAMINVYAKVPSDWIDPCLWAWSAPDGTNVFANWPGQEMEQKGSWYTYSVPAWVNSIIVNGNAGTVQTEDISIESKDVWLVVEAADNYTLTYEEPEIEEETFTVHAKVPSDWISPCLWAWSAPDGTNVFANWPGQEMDMEDDWYVYSIPTWVNSIIVNGMLGSVQTEDISVEAKDLWLVVKDADNYELFYEEPSEDDLASLEGTGEEVVKEEDSEETASEKTDEEVVDETDDTTLTSGEAIVKSSKVIWIVVISAIVCAAVIVIIVLMKKKSNEQ